MIQTHHLAIGAPAAAALRSAANTGGRSRVVDLGPEHPSRTGLLLIELESRDDVVTAARIQPGFNHRSAEKLFEARDYRQLLMLADRHDWHSPFTGELGMALVCEQLMGLVPPPRATWLRTLLAEQARIGSHLAHLSFLPHHTQEQGLATRLRGLRITARELMLAISGNRVHPMLNRLGGLGNDVDAHWVARIEQWARDCAQLAADLDQLVVAGEIGLGVGVLDARLIDGHSLSGPVAAAAGIDRTLRRRNPYLAYPELADELANPGPQLPVDGDAAARFRVLAAEVQQSSRLISRCAETLANIDGPVDTKLSKIVKLPEGEAYLAVDAPWGMAGFWLVSRAERTPWRLKLRTPSLANVQALETVLVNCPLSQVDVVIASMGWTNGDLDK
ncbi:MULTISPECIES: NADH-quinone oxidoreductase subunit D-related protein [unclassified Luteococcus]|uniref:NADH-quinone oxidoreductase subunit D-related protein n=1 Tax=unclassified Luteococcus TaxID=2639923 RepID=UPI00313C6A9E